MSAEHSPEGIFFDHNSTWNLVDEAIEEGLTKTPSADSAAQRKIEQGRKAGWIDQPTKERVREMVVYSDKVLVTNPPIDLLRAGILGQEGHVDWPWGGNLASVKFAQAIYSIAYENPMYINKERGSIIRNLNSRGYNITDQDLDGVLRMWEKRGGQLDWLNSDLANLIADEYKTIVEPIYLAASGVPTYGNLSMFVDERLSRVADYKKQVNKALENVVAIYFNNAITTPSPKSLREAIDMRHSSNIIEWRKKIFSLSRSLAKGEISERAIKEEIEEANEYIRAAGITSYTAVRWALLVAGGASLAISQFVPELQSLGNWIGATVFTTEVWGSLVEMAVKHSNNEKSGWLLVSNR